MTDDLLETAKRNFRLVYETEARQRQRERDDIKFQVAENQWSELAKQERQGRPMLSVSLLHQPMQLIQNQAAAARLGVNIEPVSETASTENAEIKQDLYRRIERDGGAEQARLWALDHAKQCGRGWYRINTQWDEDADNPSDQEIVFERILHQQMIYMDPTAQKADYSDAKWGFMAAWIRPDDFRTQYPDAKYSDAQDFEGLGETAPDWVRRGDEGLEILIVEYFYKVPMFEEINLDAAGGPYKRKRERTMLRRAVMTAGEILEDDEFPITLIPLIPVIGRELQPIEGERRWEGMVRPARDAQQFFNYSISTAVERMAMEPKAPFVAYKEQIEGYEEMWKQVNTRNQPYLLANALTAEGKLMQLPQRAQIDQTGTSLAMMGIELAKSLVQSATAIFDPSLGEPSKRQESGRRVLALQQQADASTSNYIQSMASISMLYEARVVLAWMPIVYDRPGRITTVLGGEDEIKTVMLGKPYVMKDGRPVPVPPGTQGAKEHDLRRGKYSISVSVGKSFQTRLQQGKEELGELLPNLPPEIQVMALPTYMRFRDTPGAKELADLLVKFRDAKFPMLADSKDGEITLEQAMSKISALEQQSQQMGMQLKMAGQMIETDRAKQEAMLLKTRMDNESKERIAAADNETKLAIEGLAQRMEALIALQKAAHEDARQHNEMAHEVAMAAAGANTLTYSREKGQETGEEQKQDSARESEAGT